MEKNQPKITLAEALIVGPLFFIIPDLIELFLIFFGLDDFFILDTYSLLTTQIYLRMRGLKAGFSLIMSCLELIPYIGALPLRTVGFMGVIILDRNPNLGQVVSKASGGIAKTK